MNDKYIEVLRMKSLGADDLYISKALELDLNVVLAVQAIPEIQEHFLFADGAKIDSQVIIF